MKTKTFHVGDVLSVTSEVMVSPNGMKGYHELINFLRDNASDAKQTFTEAECRAQLLGQFPYLDTSAVRFAIAEVRTLLQTPTGQSDPDNLLLGWLSKLTSGQYGVKIPENLEVKSFS